MDETFLLTNIAPQVGDGFNRHCMCYHFSVHVPGHSLTFFWQTGRTWRTGAED